MPDRYKTKTLVSPLYGTVSSILVTEGQEVSLDEVLLSVEAMKIFYDVRSPANGVVSKILAGLGSVTMEGSPLIMVSWKIS